ncbi:putative gustatory receptor 36a [Drosophila tropicalis]|uniref:putative gustatory receptor 36a n=1 Tax=Drosophila tropicalis TaxID=46794 RepID=UPI0035AB78CB
MSNLIFVEWILHIHYYYSRFMGILNFQMNPKTGRARVTIIGTIYAVIINGLFFCMFPVLILRSSLFFTLWDRPNLIHQSLLLAASVFRIGGVYLSLIIRWRRRRKVMRLFNGFWSLYVAKPRVRHLLRRGVLCKFLCAFFLGMVTNDDRIKGGLMTRCCYLADRVDEIAKTQSDLQTLNELMIEIFGVQGFCIAFIYYLTTVALIYFTFTAAKSNMFNLKLSMWSTVFTCSYILFYFSDGFFGVFIMFYVLDADAEMRRLMGDRTLLAPSLDERLETALENLQLQLLRNPLKLSVLHLYDVERPSAMIMINSVVINSLLLIQYDIEHF